MTGKRIPGRDRFGRSVGRILDAYAASRHYVSNVDVTIDGDTASSTFHVYAFHRIMAAGEVWHLWLRIADRHLRTADGSLITEHILRGVDIQPSREDIPAEWYAGHVGQLHRQPLGRLS